MTAARRKSLIFPREHGAWGILLVPLVTGGVTGLAAGGHGWMLAPLTMVVLSLFWLRTPVESWMGTVPTKARTAEEFRLVRRTVAGLATVSGLALVWLFRGEGNLALVGLGVAAAAAFLAQAVIRVWWRMASQIVGAAGLTAVAPAAYYAVTGNLHVAAWSLWAANLLFAANQIWFVQLRIRSARAVSRGERLAAGKGFLAGQIGLMVVLGAWAGSWYVAAAFAPVLFRGFAWFVAGYRPLEIRALGKSELAHACSFGVLLLAGLTRAL